MSVKGTSAIKDNISAPKSNRRRHIIGGLRAIVNSLGLVIGDIGTSPIHTSYNLYKVYIRSEED
jgi:K+ transporter